MKNEMKASVIALLFVGLILLIPDISRSAGLSLTVPDAPLGSNVTGAIGFQDADGVIGFSLLLTFSPPYVKAGPVLSSNESHFSRNPAFFPSVPVGEQEANFVSGEPGNGGLRLVGLAPNSASGVASIGTIRFAVTSKKPPKKEVATQVVTLSGQAYIDKGNKKVEAIDLLPVSVTFSAVNTPPRKPSHPSPANNADGIPVDAVLSWKGGDPDSGNSVVYQVDLGKQNPPPLAGKTKNKTEYKPEARLAYNKRFYWKVTAKDNLGAKAVGPLWSFKTFTQTGDEDHDGLANRDEIEKYRTDPLKGDTDGDGMPDGWEVENGLDPTKDDSEKDADKDGYTSLEECQSGTDPVDFHSKPQPVCLVPDVSADGRPEVAVLWWNAVTSSSDARIKDSSSGLAVSELTFDARYKHKALAVGDRNGACAIAALGMNPDTGVVMVEVRDAATGASVKNVTFGKGIVPKGLAVLSDMDGNSASELAVLCVKSDTGDVVVQIRDAVSGASITDVTFDKAYDPKAFSVIPDIDGSGAPGLAILGVKADTGELVAQVKNAKTGGDVRIISFAKAFAPRGFSVVPNIDGSGAPGLAVLGVKAATEEVAAQVKNAITGDLVANISFDKAYVPRDLAALPGINANHDSALAVLGVKAGTGDVTVQVVDARTGAFVNKVAFPKTYAPKAMVMLPDLNGDDVPELAVLGVKVETGEVMLEIKDAVNGNSIKAIAIQ